MTAAQLQGSYLRVLPYRPDFAATQWLLVRGMARTALLPLALTAVPAFGLWAYLGKSALQLPPRLWWPDFAGLLFTLHALGVGWLVVMFVIFVLLL